MAKNVKAHLSMNMHLTQKVRNKYKYYVNGTFKVGTMDSLLGGTYPELEDCPDKLCP